MTSSFAFPLDPEPEELDPVLDVAHPCLAGRQAQPDRGERLLHLLPQRFGVGSGSGDHEDQIIRVADESPVPQPRSPPRPALVGGAHLLPVLGGEVVVERRQRDVGQQRRKDAALGCAGVGVFLSSELGQDPGVEEHPDKAQHSLVPDPSPHPTGDSRMRDVVEARLDIALQHPLVRVARQVMRLGDRVVRAPARAEPVRARLEVRLENGFEHQLQRRLDHSVCHGGSGAISARGVAG